MKSTIRHAKASDIRAIWTIFSHFPDLSPGGRASEQAEYAELLRAIKGPIFLVGMDDHGDVVGFIYVRVDDIDRPPDEKGACLVYVAVFPVWQRYGIADALWEHAQQILQKMKIENVYAWCASRPVMALLSKHGFKPGGSYTWMDKKIQSNVRPRKNKKA